ncbi:MAG: hypothetical protein EXR45_02455 [Chloroflexi bacterium]|nr:hypothetical protein [Chloroflexota bacterium]
MYRVGLPLFPLNVVLFPDAPLPLHIFEERYREMIRECLENDRSFGVILATPQETTAGTGHHYSIGTIAHIVETRPYPDGRFDILCLGRERFRVESHQSDRAFHTASVTILSETGARPAHADADEGTVNGGAIATQTIVELRIVLTTLISATVDDDARAEQLGRIVQAIPNEPIALSYFAARILPTANLADRQELLEIPDVSSRLIKIQQHLKRERLVANQLEDISKNPLIRGETAGTVFN